MKLRNLLIISIGIIVMASILCAYVLSYILNHDIMQEEPKQEIKK